VVEGPSGSEGVTSAIFRAGVLVRRGRRVRVCKDDDSPAVYEGVESMKGSVGVTAEVVSSSRIDLSFNQVPSNN